MTTEERLRSLLEAATPLPWVQQSSDDGVSDPWWLDTHAYPDGPEPVWAPPQYPVSGHDAALIVEAVNALPKLLAVVARLREFAAVHNPECPAASWTPENRTLRICHCGLESVRAALAALDEP